MGLCVRFVRGLALAGVLLGGILVGAGTLSVAGSTAAVAQSVNSIEVQGNRRVEAGTIRAYFHPGPGGRLGPAEIDEGLKALYATGLFADVHIEHPGGRLLVVVTENPVINQVAFEGNKKAKDDQLKTEVQSKPRGTLSKPTVQADVQRIIEIYHRSGRFDVTVTPQIIELPNNRVNLVFEIREGEKTGVKDIRFIGAHAFSTGRLKNVIKTSISNWLSFLQTTDIYDPDRVEADRDLLRRFYLQHGYADVRILSAIGEYDPAAKGFVITFTIDEGAQYKVGTIDVVSNVRAIDPSVVRSQLKLSTGSVYNADLVQKSVEAMTIEASRRGYAFANVRPRGDRNVQTHTINLSFIVEEGARAYIERINVRGNIRTRDYVIRREFDIGEGDAYNRALIDRAERRLKNLGFFKTVKITNEPGSAPDRVVVNVDVEEQPTGQFSIAGGYSTADGFISEVSIADRNLMGRGQYAKASVSYGQYSRGVELNFVEPYLLGYRMAGGVDLFWRQNLANNYSSYGTKTVGTNLRLGFGLTEELSFAPRYSIYRQEISLIDQYNNCKSAPNALINGGTGVVPNDPSGCYSDGEASLPVRKELQGGTTLTSAVGYSLDYNTLDNNKNPTDGLLIDFKQDYAGVGGDVSYLKSAFDAKYYAPLVSDIVGLIHVQGGILNKVGSNDLRMLDQFQMGPNLVRGFAPNGIGPRDINPYGTQDAIGGTKYWGASVELQMPFWFLPKDVGLKGAIYADAGGLYDYQGPTTWAATGEVTTPQNSNCARPIQVNMPGGPNPGTCTGLVYDNSKTIRSSVGIGLIWASPFGPLRFDYAIPLTKGPFDVVQEFKFGGGTSF